MPRYLLCSALLSAVCAARLLGQEEPKQTGADEKPAAGAEAGPRFGESRTQKWEFGISIRAVGGPCGGVFGTFPVPADWPEQETKVASEQITPHVQRHSYRSIDGLKQMLFEIPQVGTGDTATCFVTYEVTRRAQLAPANKAELIIPKDPPRDVKKHLGTSPLIESTNAKVRGFAKEWTAGKETAWEQVEGILDGVRQKVAFEPDNKTFKGALGALRDEKADREDMTAAFVAVCRAAKVPARMVWAIDFCYAEFYLEPKESEEENGGKAKSSKAKGDKEERGAWYPCVVHEKGDVGTVRDFRPIIGKGDDFKVPEDRAVQRWVKEFLSVKSAGGKPAVEFRKKSAD